jgi:hypothetical protein
VLAPCFPHIPDVANRKKLIDFSAAVLISLLSQSFLRQFEMYMELRFIGLYVETEKPTFDAVFT